MAKYTVKEIALRKGGALHPVGSEVDMGEEAAAPLVAQGRLEPAAKAGKTDAKKGGGQQGGDAQDQG